MLVRIAGTAVALFFWSSCISAAEDIRFDIPTLPGFQRHTELLAQPGLLAVALENNDLSPSESSKLKVAEQGKAAEIRRATLRFVGRKGSLFTYEAGYLLGIGDTKVSFPVSVDLSELSTGKTKIILLPPMASLMPGELTERIKLKSQLMANADAQRKLLAYLDRVSKEGDPARAILIDAYNRSAAPMAVDTRDAGDALPLSDQWMLILTLIIWLVALPALLLWYRRRSRRAPGKPA